jgi:hypothetical protein
MPVQYSIFHLKKQITARRFTAAGAAKKVIVIPGQTRNLLL